MAQIEVVTDKWFGEYRGNRYDHAHQQPDSGQQWWIARDDEGHSLWFLPDEIRVMGKHEGEYDPEHWGEKDPDAYDRMSYALNVQGRHLLDTGVN